MSKEPDAALKTIDEIAAEVERELREDHAIGPGPRQIGTSEPAPKPAK